MSREKPSQVEDKAGRAGGGAPIEPEEPPARAAAYIPPMAAPKESRYHTIDMKAVRLSPDIDPQRMKTQLSLRAVKAVEERRPSRLPAWIALLLVGGALGTCVWWFARWRHVQTAPALAAAAVPSPMGVSPSPPVTASAPEVTARSAPTPVVVATVVAESTDSLPSAPAASPSPAEPSPKPTVRAVPRVQKPGPVKLAPAPRKVTSPSANPAAEGAQPASSQPKLWLE